MGVDTSGENVCFVGVEVDPKSFFQSVRRVEIEGLPPQPLSLLDTCARWVALELEGDPFSLDLTQLPLDLRELIQDRIYRFDHYKPLPLPSRERLLELKEERWGPSCGYSSDTEDGLLMEEMFEDAGGDWDDDYECPNGRCKAVIIQANECLGLKPVRDEAPGSPEEDSQCYRGRVKRRPWLGFYAQEVFSNYQNHPLRVFLRAIPNHFSYSEPDWRKFKSGQWVNVVRPPSARERLVVVDALRLLRIKPLAEQPEFMVVRMNCCG